MKVAEISFTHLIDHEVVDQKFTKHENDKQIAEEFEEKFEESL
jgi:hypothetical protein